MLPNSSNRVSLIPTDTRFQDQGICWRRLQSLATDKTLRLQAHGVVPIPRQSGG